MMNTRDIERMIQTELAPYPVHYSICHGAKRPYVELVDADTGSRGRVTFSQKGGSSLNLLNIRGDLRRELRQMGCQPLSQKRRDVAPTGPIGEALMQVLPPPAEPKRPLILMPPPKIEDAPAATPEPPPVLALEPERKPAPMSTANASNGTNGHHKAPPPAVDKPKYNKLTNSEVARATRLICENANVDDVKKIVVYNEGWSDERIAAILRTGEGRDGIKALHVTNLRRESFGQTPAEIESAAYWETKRNGGNAGVTLQTLMDGLKDLKSRLDQFDQRLTSVEDVVTR